MRVFVLKFFCLILLIISCDDNSTEPIEPIDCSPLIFQGIDLTEESNQFFMYQNVERVIFKDSINTEYIVDVDFLEGEEEYEELRDCDGPINQSVKYFRQIRKVELTFPADSALSVLFILRTEFERRETEFIESNLLDKLIIQDKRTPEGGTEVTISQSYTTSIRNSNYNIETINDHFEEFENYEFFGNSFGEAIKALGNNEIYISRNLGLIKIKDLTGKTLIFDRIE